MKQKIIVGKSNSEYFLKLVENFCQQKNFQEIFSCQAGSLEGLCKKIDFFENSVLEKISQSQTFHFGMMREEDSGKLVRCQNLSREEILTLKNKITQIVTQKV